MGVRRAPGSLGGGRQNRQAQQDKGDQQRDMPEAPHGPIIVREQRAGAGSGRSDFKGPLLRANAFVKQEREDADRE